MTEDGHQVFSIRIRTAAPGGRVMAVVALTTESGIRAKLVGKGGMRDQAKPCCRC